MQTKSQIDPIIYRHPVTDDGPAMHDLAVRSRTLDVNSCYHYLIMGRHFSKTSMIAVSEGRAVGFVTGYMPPEEPDTLFVWQVTVDSEFRGRGVALSMLEALIRSFDTRQPAYLTTTITKSNAASISLFTALSRRLDAPHQFNEIFFSEAQFGKSGHSAEMLFRIGPALHLS